MITHEQFNLALREARWMGEGDNLKFIQDTLRTITGLSEVEFQESFSHFAKCEFLESSFSDFDDFIEDGLVKSDIPQDSRPAHPKDDGEDILQECKNVAGKIPDTIEYKIREDFDLETEPEVRVSPSDWKKTHGRCPPGYHWNDETERCESCDG